MQLMELSSNSVVIIAVIMLACIALSKHLRPGSSEAHKRGARVIDISQRRILPRRRRALPQQVTMAGVAIPALDETKHFKLIGTTGTGKSTAIREILETAIRRGDRVIFADPDGGYLARFHSRFRGDIVLNPFEQDSVKWDLFAEIKNRYDIEQLASGLVSNGQDPAAREWRGYARTFLAAVVRRCHDCAWRDTANLWHLLMVASPDELRPMVADTPAQPFLDAENARMFGSIRSVTGSAIAALEYDQRRSRSGSG
jgi:hypothetical protein